jgi:hypothetical protein
VGQGELEAVGPGEGGGGDVTKGRTGRELISEKPRSTGIGNTVARAPASTAELARGRAPSSQRETGKPIADHLVALSTMSAQAAKRLIAQRRPLLSKPPGDLSTDCRDVLAPSTPSLRSGVGPAGLDGAALVADRRLRPRRGQRSPTGGGSDEERHVPAGPGGGGSPFEPGWGTRIRPGASECFLVFVPGGGPISAGT